MKERGRLREWTPEPDNLWSLPTSATSQLCELEQVTSLLCAPVSSPTTQGCKNTDLPGLFGGMEESVSVKPEVTSLP